METGGGRNLFFYQYFFTEFKILKIENAPPPNTKKFRLRRALRYLTFWHSEIQKRNKLRVAKLELICTIYYFSDILVNRKPELVGSLMRT